MFRMGKAAWSQSIPEVHEKCCTPSALAPTSVLRFAISRCSSSILDRTTGFAKGSLGDLERLGRISWALLSWRPSDVPGRSLGEWSRPLWLFLREAYESCTGRGLRAGNGAWRGESSQARTTVESYPPGALPRTGGAHSIDRAAAGDTTDRRVAQRRGARCGEDIDVDSWLHPLLHCLGSDSAQDGVNH